MPNFSVHFELYQKEIFLIFVMIISTVCYYLISSNICKISILLISLISVTLVLTLKVSLAMYPAFFLIFIYCNSTFEKTKKSLQNNNDIFFGFISPVAACAITINISSLLSAQYVKSMYKDLIIALIFIIVFALLLYNFRKTKNIEKKLKRFYRNFYIVTIISFLASVTSLNHMLNYSVAFFPYFFLITLLVFDEDKSVQVFSKTILDSLKKFLN